VIKEKLERYLKILSNIEDAQDKFMWIMDFGKNSRPMSDSLKVRDFEVRGCQSQTWLVPHFVEDKIYFSADSAALISKGMVCIIADVYSGAMAQDIRDFDQKEFEKMNLSSLLTPGRNNGVHSMLQKIKFYARENKENQTEMAS
jgi:cysteine desulfuration protein SufE